MTMHILENICPKKSFWLRIDQPLTNMFNTWLTKFDQLMTNIRLIAIVKKVKGLSFG